ncbi:MAG: site-specific DNA-methyltransferase [Acidimicrobiia bacterium]|nr:site-specific DNA-methyltransferase [Acidimicrobiia bacterium]MYB25196.1 site-specific DNA-methyltransferase [Acidimicrobiia bacterium]
MTTGSNGSHPPDIKPRTPISALQPERYSTLRSRYPLDSVAKAVGMSPTFVRKVFGKRTHLTAAEVLTLLDQDSFRETFVPRSRVIDHLESHTSATGAQDFTANPLDCELRQGNALDLLESVPGSSVQCVVTSTPYWGMRLYECSHDVTWADGEHCAFGHEQTPEGFIRHTVQVLDALSRVLTDDGSIWWNVMDSFNTRTQVRGSALEALRAMEGKDGRKWREHDVRRYSAGHSYLKDGEQCLIPALIAQRASAIGLYVKTVITWAKRGSLPEPQHSRVSRNLEYIMHITKNRTPKFSRDPYHLCDPVFGGRNPECESEKLSDVWVLATSGGGNGHGAQFPVALPGRCIALTTEPGDLVLDPFVGTGNSGIAAGHHRCAFLGFDVSEKYLSVAEERIGRQTPRSTLSERYRLVG